MFNREIQIDKKKCHKCGDLFVPTYGGCSERTSCRVHNYDENNKCICCGKDPSMSHNCYHKVKQPKQCTIL